MKEERNMYNVLKIILYIIFSSTGLIFLKMGVSKNFGFSLKNGSFSIEINFILIIGMILYVAAFLTSLISMQGMNLNIFYPISAGAIYILVCLLSRVMLREEMSMQQLIGMTIILLGIIVMNLKK